MLDVKDRLLKANHNSFPLGINQPLDVKDRLLKANHNNVRFIILVSVMSKIVC